MVVEIGSAVADPWQWGWEAAAAIATVLAVVLAGVALWHESSRARQAQQAEWNRADALRREEQERVERKSLARADRLALAIDHELYSYGSALATAEFLLSDDRLGQDANGVMIRVLRDVAGDNLSLLKSFIGDLDDFPVEVSTLVASVLGTLNAFRAASLQVPVTANSKEAVALGMQIRLNAMVSARVVRMAREALRPYSSKYREFKDFATAIDLHRQAGETPTGEPLRD